MSKRVGSREEISGTRTTAGECGVFVHRGAGLPQT